MNRFPTRLSHLSLLGLLAATVLIVSGCAPALAQAPTEGPSTRAITVVGQGTISVKPNLAIANLGVETMAPTVAEAMAENNTKMTAIIGKLKELNIPDKDIQTSGFSIYSWESGVVKGVAADSAGGTQYRVSNTVQVKVRQPEQLGAVLDAVIEAGVNQVHGVNFTVEDPQALQGEAREKAVADAKQRAEALAKLANVKVGQVLTMTEASAGVPVWDSGIALGRGAAGAETPLSPGEVQLSYQIQVTYAIQ